jgi:hypothetical protein
MLELISYGLTGLASMVVFAFCIVCGDNDAAILEKSAAPLNKAKLNASPKMQTVTADPRIARTDRQPQVAQPSLLQTASLVETGYHRDCRGTVNNGRSPAEASNG